MIRFLHISDLHFNNDDMSSIRLRKKLIEYFREKNLHFDYIFCTGDLRTVNCKNNSFLKETSDYLRELCSTTGTNISNLFIVPGNHDVDREAEGRDETIKKVCFHRNGYYDPKYGTINDDDLEIINSGQIEFRDFLKTIYPEKRLEYYSNYLEPHFNIETPNFNILHVDSTLTYTKDQEASDLLIGTKPLQNALNTINKNKPTFFLSHYPIESLFQDERKYVKELLCDYNVSLILCGHQHDHNVHPIDYFDCLQAGELRMEENSNATVLVGQFDEETYEGYVEALTWFPEGWGIYPIIWHNNKNESRYNFKLKSSCKDNLPKEIIRAKQSNNKYIDRVGIIESILPEIEGSNDNNFDEILRKNWKTDKQNVMLLADGGMGKTTTLLNFCKRCEQTTLYIPLERLVSMKIGIKDYCTRVLFDGDERAFTNYCTDKFTLPSLILLIDGVNEIDADNERTIINEVNALSLFKGIQIVMTSRSDFTLRYDLSNYNIYRLKPLNDTQIESIFTKDEWSNICDTSVLHKLLSNPMMATMYKEVCPIMFKFKDKEFLNWIIPIKNATDLLFNYYIVQMAIILQHAGVNGQKIQLAYQIIFYILPELAYKYESTYSFNMPNNEFRNLLNELILKHQINENDLLPIQETYRDYNIPELKYGTVREFLVDETKLLYMDNDVISFPHQIYRDFLSAYWIIKQKDFDEYWNTRHLSYPIMEHIRNLTGDYWNGLAKHVHDSCQRRYDASIMINNLFECFPYSENSGLPNYSNLYLHGIKIPNIVCHLDGKILLKGSKIDAESIGKSKKQYKLFKNLCFSNDNKYLGATSNFEVIVFSLEKQKMVFSYEIDENIDRLVFVKDYLFVVAGGDTKTIRVFNKNGSWNYIGRLSNENQESYSLLNKYLRKIVLSNNELYFYYNNRVLQFSLFDCKLIKNIQQKFDVDSLEKGLDITYLNKVDNFKSDNSNGVLWETSNLELTAISKIDGSLIISNGNEVQYYLVKGDIVFKDACISGNGKYCATLSYELIDNKRKIQLWSLDNKRRMKDIFCPNDIKEINLSEDGEFIFGKNENQTWVYDIENKTSKVYDEFFISSQYNKVTSYKSKVLRNDKDLNIYLYDLKTEEVVNIDDDINNVRLACFMPNGSIAYVGNSVCKVIFKKYKTNCYTNINYGKSKIIGIRGFEGLPFIFVATQDNVISIYHTGTCQRTRILENTGGAKIMAVNSKDKIIACSNGKSTIKMYYYLEKNWNGKMVGWWKETTYPSTNPSIDSNILDLAFNKENRELVVILSNGQILFYDDIYCKYHSCINIITNFDVDDYDFRGCACDKDIKEQINQNKSLI